MTTQNTDMFSKISLKAFCAYEKLTGKNSMDLFKKQEGQSMTDIRDMAFLVSYTADNTTTFEKIENLSSAEFQELMSKFSAEKTDV